MLQRADEHRERRPDGHVERDLTSAQPVGSPHRSAVTGVVEAAVVMVRVWPVPSGDRSMPVSDSRQRLSVAGCRMVT